MMKLRINPIVAEDLKKMKEYIAEDNEEMCRKVNAEGTENIAKVCKALDIPMIYISTDYVFEGEGTRPWEPDDNYVVLYKIGKEYVEIYRVVNRHQDITKIF